VRKPIAKTAILTGLTYDTLVSRFERELGHLDAKCAGAA
jgi:hypothetical protein